MVTFATQKTRIADEMVRSDLAAGGAREGLLEQHYQDAVAHYANDKFWFNSVLTTVNTVATVATVNIPATVRRVEKITIPALQRTLREVTMADIPKWEDVTGVPEVYAYFNDQLRFYPVPDAVYTLQLYGLAQIAAPSANADDNIWTNEAAPLIRAHTKATLYRGVYRDPEGTQLALAEEIDALDRLRRETARRLDMPLTARPWRMPYRILSD
jgi:hypothetical protein